MASVALPAMETPADRDFGTAHNEKERSVRWVPADARTLGAASGERRRSLYPGYEHVHLAIREAFQTELEDYLRRAASREAPPPRPNIQHHPVPPQ